MYKIDMSKIKDGDSITVNTVEESIVLRKALRLKFGKHDRRIGLCVWIAEYRMGGCIYMDTDGWDYKEHAEKHGTVHNVCDVINTEFIMF